MPDWVMDDMHPAIRQFSRERPHGQIGLLGEARQQPVSGRALQLGAAVPADLAMPLTQPGLSPLAHPNRRSHRNPEPLCRLTNRRSFPKSRGNPIPQINRQW